MIIDDNIKTEIENALLYIAQVGCHMGKLYRMPRRSLRNMFDFLYIESGYVNKGKNNTSIHGSKDSHSVIRYTSYSYFILPNNSLKRSNFLSHLLLEYRYTDDVRKCFHTV